MQKILSSIKENSRIICVVYLFIMFITLAFFWPDPQMWVGKSFDSGATDRWIYIRYFQSLTLILFFVLIKELNSNEDKVNKKSNLFIIFTILHFLILIYTLFLDISFLQHRHEEYPLGKYNPLLYLIIVILLGRTILQVLFFDELKTVFSDLIFIALAYFFSNSKNQMSEGFFNISFGFLFIILIIISYSRSAKVLEEYEIQKDEQIEQNSIRKNKIMFLRLFIFSLWLFIFSTFVVIANNSYDFSFNSFYISFCLIGFLFLASLNSNFYYILLSVILLVVAFICTLKVYPFIKNLDDTLKYLTSLPLLISILLLTISILGISYIKIKMKDIKFL